MRRPTAFLAGLWIERLNQIEQQPPRQFRSHLGKTRLALVRLFGGGLCGINKALLLACNPSSPGLRSVWRAHGNLVGRW
jgi:hypothetical protein